MGERLDSRSRSENPGALGTARHSVRGQFSRRCRDVRQHVAIRRTSRWIYIGKDSLTTICEVRLGQNAKWQEIPVLTPI
jgi:hypothetical protein